MVRRDAAYGDKSRFMRGSTSRPETEGVVMFEEMEEPAFPEFLAAFWAEKGGTRR